MPVQHSPKRSHVFNQQSNPINMNNAKFTFAQIVQKGQRHHRYVKDRIGLKIDESGDTDTIEFLQTQCNEIDTRKVEFKELIEEMERSEDDDKDNFVIDSLLDDFIDLCNSVLARCQKLINDRKNPMTEAFILGMMDR